MHDNGTWAITGGAITGGAITGGTMRHEGPMRWEGAWFTSRMGGRKLRSRGSRLWGARGRSFCAAVLCCALFALGACTTNRATGEKTFTAFMSEAQEMKVGREENPKIVKAYGGAYGSTALNAYVRAVGARLAKVSERPHMRFTFTILNDKDVNAFALPGGYVYVTRGLLAVASDEAELAGVLAHEIGHVMARHTAQRYSQAQVANIGLTLLDILGRSAGFPAGTGNIAAYGAEAVLMSYSRSQELEADRLGIRYMTRAGYDPHAVVDFFRKLEAVSKLRARISGASLKRGADIMATHPRTEQRIAQAKRLAAQAHGGGLTYRREAYLDAISGIIFGDSPAQGIFLAGRFVHPGLRIAFNLPPGFHGVNTPTRVLAHDDAGNLLVFDMALPKDVDKAFGLRDYVRRVWGGQAEISDLQDITVNGMAGVTGAGWVRQAGRSRYVRLVAIRERPGRVYRFLFSAPDVFRGALATAFKRTTYSFTRLGAREAARIRPRTIQVRTVRAGDTIARLSRPMAVDDAVKAAWFEALNAIRRNEDLKVGMKVKVIAE